MTEEHGNSFCNTCRWYKSIEPYFADCACPAIGKTIYKPQKRYIGRSDSHENNKLNDCKWYSYRSWLSRNWPAILVFVLLSTMIICLGIAKRNTCP